MRQVLTARIIARTREAAILSARAQGMPAARIADLLGTDRQIVYRILKRA